MASVSTLPNSEKILFHAHMLADLCEKTPCCSCPLLDADEGGICLLCGFEHKFTRDEIERRFQDARNKREKE